MDEKIYYKDEHVKITDLRITANHTTAPIGKIDSVIVDFKAMSMTVYWRFSCYRWSPFRSDAVSTAAAAGSAACWLSQTRSILCISIKPTRNYSFPLARGPSGCLSPTCAVAITSSASPTHWNSNSQKNGKKTIRMNINNKPIKLSPHHALDIFKYLGSAAAADPIPFRHARHEIARKISRAPGLGIRLVRSRDDICKTCCYLNLDNLCFDMFMQFYPEVCKNSSEYKLEHKA